MFGGLATAIRLGDRFPAKLLEGLSRYFSTSPVPRVYGWVVMRALVCIGPKIDANLSGRKSRALGIYTRDRCRSLPFLINLVGIFRPLFLVRSLNRALDEYLETSRQLNYCTLPSKSFVRRRHRHRVCTRTLSDIISPSPLRILAHTSHTLSPIYEHPPTTIHAYTHTHTSGLRETV